MPPLRRSGGRGALTRRRRVRTRSPSKLGVDDAAPRRRAGASTVPARTARSGAGRDVANTNSELSSRALADHMSIALQTANTLAQLCAAEGESRKALQRLMTDHVAVLDRFNGVDQKLVQPVLPGDGLTLAATNLARTWERSATIADADMRVLACSPTVRPHTGSDEHFRRRASRRRAKPRDRPLLAQ